MMGFWDLVRLELRTLLADRAIMLTLFGGVFFYSFLYPQPYLHQLPREEPVVVVNEDGSHVRKVKAHAPGESCTHEFWVPDGSALIYVSYLKGQQGRTIYRFDPESGVNEALMTMPACSHLMSNFDGTLLVGDILQVTPGADAVSFMWSYPNMLPLPARTVEDVTRRLAGKSFARLYGAFEGQNIPANADAIVQRSGQKYIACLK